MLRTEAQWLRAPRCVHLINAARRAQTPQTLIHNTESYRFLKMLRLFPKSFCNGICSAGEWNEEVFVLCCCVDVHRALWAPGVPLFPGTWPSWCRFDTPGRESSLRTCRWSVPGCQSAALQRLEEGITETVRRTLLSWQWKVIKYIY